MCEMFYREVFYQTLNFPYKLFIFSNSNFFIFELAIFLLSSFLLFFNITSSKKSSLIHAIIAAQIVFAVIGVDFVSWRTCVFPLLVLTTLQGGWFSLFFTILWCLFSSSLAIFGILVSALVAIFAFNKKLDFYLLLSFFVSVLISIPQATIPDYPGDAHLLPLSVNAVNTIFAPEHFFKILNLPNFKILLERSVAVFVGCFAAWFICFRPSIKNKYLVLTLAFFFLVFLGELLSYQFMPYKFLYRIVPGIALLPFVWDLTIIFSTLIITLCLKFSTLKTTPAMKEYVLILLLALFVLKPNNLQAEKVNFDSDLNQKIKLSPSSYVIDYWGDWILQFQEKKFRKLIVGKDYNYLAQASANAKDANFAIDNNIATRWSTKGPQKGGEVFKIKIAPKVDLAKLVLNLGQNRSDFPRGLKIEAADIVGNKIILFDKHDWLGPVKFSPDGYPYFGPQADVEVIFEKPQETTELIITQTGSDATYDWSIAEIGLYAD